LTRQLALDLGHRPALGREDFLVATGNRDAVALIDRWPDWPTHVLGIYGPAGCGTSHLVQVFAARSRAAVVAASGLSAQQVPALCGRGAVAVEHDGRVDERALLHLFNALKECGGHLLLAAREAPARWDVSLPDLKSRLSAVPAVRIAAPDDAMMEAVLVKLFADRQLAVAPDVVGYLARRIDRSFAAARRVVAEADRDSLAGGRAITVPSIKPLLSRLSIGSDGD
jgi:chromosomal replication initiation ATPase DnaA